MRQTVLVEERLKFHQASGYNYSGERGASKVSFCVVSSGAPAPAGSSFSLRRSGSSKQKEIFRCVPLWLK